MKPAHLRPQAKVDLSDQAFYYAVEGGAALANRFVDEALAALSAVESQPRIGSPRWNVKSELPALRAWRSERFPLSWLYCERDDHLDVARLRGERQDIESILKQDPP